MKIAMVASESNPFIKSGGLADVVYSLSKEEAKLGNEVSIFLPFYKSIKNKLDLPKREFCFCTVESSWRHQGCMVYEVEIPNVENLKFYFVENNYYFNRDNIYGYMDDGERFAFYNLIIRKIMRVKKMHFDVIHCHDWQTGMLPVLIKEQNLSEAIFKDTKFAMTIHNEAFLGNLDRFFVNDFYGLSDYLYDIGKLRFKNQFSTLKSGIVYADIVTTVSPNHRDELLTPEFGQGLEYVLEQRKGSFYGIVNGVDYDEFNPKKDEFLSNKMYKSNLEKPKLANKQALLDFFNLPNNDGPIFGLVSRLTWQKGIDLVLAIAPKIVENGGSIIVLGSGEAKLEQGFEELRSKYPDRVGIYIGYSNKIAHKVYGGSDFFLMPSLFEPCGIGQMIAKRYATLPIVRSIGGLKDTVTGFDGNNIATADGISFRDYNYEGINFAIDKAFEVYHNHKLFNKMRLNAFNCDHSWKKSANEYLSLYKEV